MPGTVLGTGQGYSGEEDRRGSSLLMGLILSLEAGCHNLSYLKQKKAISDCNTYHEGKISDAV